MIAIDNAIELTIQTYLGLPKRVTGLKIRRKEFAEMSESFPALLDGLERYANDKLAGIDLGEIEWFHRLRNELYHQGNGLTVERDKVEVYAQGRGPIGVEKRNGAFFRLLGVGNPQPAARPGGHRRNAPWQSISGWRGGRMTAGRARSAS
jgi:hypothetical protein